MPGVEGVTSLRVRYGETDAMGWVYYGTYFLYFEVGRTELIRNVWRAYREIEDGGLRLPVVEAGCRYHRGCKYDDVLEIHSRMTLPSAKFTSEIQFLPSTLWSSATHIPSRVACSALGVVWGDL